MSLSQENEKPIIRMRKRIRKRKRQFTEDINKRSKKEKVQPELDLKCYEEFSPEPKLEDTKTDEKEEETKPREMGLPPMCHCIECFAYMGEMNPRQYCRKIYCSYADFEEDELLQTKVFHLRTSPYYTDPDFWGYKDYHDEIQEFIDNNYVENPDELRY